MNNSSMGSVPAELPRKKDAAADRGPMSQQNAAHGHGYEMHLQKFVRLVGCHESTAGKHEVAVRLH
jgi:hypothetical protein